MLVRYDEEPYYFPDALLKALQRNVSNENIEISPPGSNGWNAQDLKQVERLLQPPTYPPCAMVTACLQKWKKFAHQGVGYRKGPPMPGGKQPVTFLDESWDYPEPITTLVFAAPKEEEPGLPESSEPECASERTLEERWQLTHGRDPPAWADKGFAAIQEHMQRQAAATKGTREEVTLYRPSQNLEPRHHLGAHLDARLPGIKVPVVRPVGYEEGQPIPDHALSRFQGKPADNFNVMSLVPDYLCGPWTQEYQSLRWESNTNEMSGCRKTVSGG